MKKQFLSLVLFVGALSSFCSCSGNSTSANNTNAGNAGNGGNSQAPSVNYSSLSSEGKMNYLFTSCTTDSHYDGEFSSSKYFRWNDGSMDSVHHGGVGFAKDVTHSAYCFYYFYESGNDYFSAQIGVTPSSSTEDYSKKFTFSTYQNARVEGTYSFKSGKDVYYYGVDFSGLSYNAGGTFGSSYTATQTLNQVFTDDAKKKEMNDKLFTDCLQRLTVLYKNADSFWLSSS
jgi:hypothetical protein